MTGPTLVCTTSAGARPLGVRGAPLHQSQAQIRAVVRRRLGGRHATLLTEPQPHAGAGRIDWYSDAVGPVRRMADLPPDEAAALRRDVDALLADIARVGGELEDGPTDDGRLAGASLRLAATPPAGEYLFRVGDQPVVACWGYEAGGAGAVLPGAFLPATRIGGPPAEPTSPAGLPGSFAAAPAAPAFAGPAAAARAAPFAWALWLPLGLLTIALLLGASWALRHVLPVPPGLEIAALPAPPPPPLPAAPDPSAALEAAIAAAQAQEPRLRATLASLREDAATRLALCKPPEPPRPTKPPEPQVAAKPTAPPKPPDDRMRMPDKPTGDYSFLKGCWRTDPFKHRPEQTESGVSTYCFDDKGRGTLTFRRGARTCRTPATARFEGGTLRIKDGDTTCSDGAAWSQDRLDCTRGADDVAICRGEAQGPNGMDRWQVRLHRQK